VRSFEEITIKPGFYEVVDGLTRNNFGNASSYHTQLISAAGSAMYGKQLSHCRPLKSRLVKSYKTGDIK